MILEPIVHLEEVTTFKEILTVQIIDLTPLEITHLLVIRKSILCTIFKFIFTSF